MRVPKVYLYGIFQGDVCEYIGCTENPSKRASDHGRRFPGCTFKILKVQSRSALKNGERKLIAFYKAKGEARFNRRLGLKRPIKIGSKYTVYECSNGRTFSCISEIGKRLGVCYATARNIFRIYGGKYAGLTFTPVEKTD